MSPRSRPFLVMVVVEVTALALIVIAWAGSSGSTSSSVSLSWLNAGCGGVVVGYAGVAGWLYFGRRQVVERWSGQLLGWASPSDADEQVRVNPVTLVTAAGMVHYHREECQLVRGKRTTPLTTPGVPTSGLSACGICRP